MTPHPLSISFFDWFLILILAWSTITAFMRGIILELFSFGGLIAGILIASWNYERFAALLAPLIQRITTSSSACDVIAFLTIVMGVMLLSGIAGKLIRRTARSIGLGFLDRLLGAAFGFLRGSLLAVAVLMAATAFLPQSSWIADSRLTPYFLGGVHAVSFVVPHGLRQQLLNGIAELKHNAPDWIKLHR